MMFLATLLAATSSLAFILAYKVKRLQKERDCLLYETKEDSKVLFLNSRYASMGETVGNIAHQWKQPLNAIGTIQNSIKAALIFQGEISKEKLLYSVETSFKLLQHLAETIDTFYSFLAQTGDEKTSFDIADEMEKIRKITEYSFENSHIVLNFELETNPTIQGNANEFTHAMLNLILNAKDAFDNVSVHSPLITVNISAEEENCRITVADNAGGIRLNPAEMVFDLHTSTKENGSGLGLYMTKNIIENRFGGRISVENKNGGACFTATLPYAEYGQHYVDTPLPDGKETLERINKLSHKIIELEELEKTLKKWADIFKHAHWGISVFHGSNNSFEMTNDAFNALYGYSKKELENIGMSDLFSPESLPLLPEIQKKACEKGYLVFEAVHVRKNGSTFPVSIELIVIKDKEGEILYRIANIWDLTDKKADEEKLLMKKFVLSHIKDTVFIIDENANFQCVNEGACTTLGYSFEEFEQMNVGDVDLDWSRERWSEHCKTLKELGSMTMELKHRCKNGTIFPVEVSINYIEFGGKAYNMAIARDITERRLLEIQKDNERMRLFFERQLVGMAITSPQYGWIDTNKKLQEMLGYSHDELCTRTWVEMTHPDDLAADMKQFEKLLRSEIEDYMLEKRFIRKDGSIVCTKLAVSCVRNDDRSVNYFLALLEDITERKAAQEALAAKEREFRALAENIPDNTARWDTEGKYLYINPVQESLLGVESTDVIGKRLNEAFPEIDFSAIDGAISQVLATGEPIRFVRQLLPTEDGKVGIHEINFVPERDTNGTITSVLGVGRDIRLQDELAEREKEPRALADSFARIM